MNETFKNKIQNAFNGIKLNYENQMRQNHSQDGVANDYKLNIEAEPHIWATYYSMAQIKTLSVAQLEIMYAELFKYTNWGNLLNVSRNLASASNGLISIQGTAGTSITKGTQFKNANGNIYETLELATIQLKTFTINNITTTGNGIVEVETTTNHNLADNLKVSISVPTQTSFDITNATITVISETKFTYNKTITTATANAGQVSSTFASLQIKSLSTGQIQNLDRGSSLSFYPINPNPNFIENTAYVQYTKISGGTELEDIEDYSSRIQEKIQTPTGSATSKGNLIKTAKEVAGTTRVWVKGADDGLPAGQIQIYHLRDNDINTLGEPDIFPDTNENDNLKNYILTKKGIEIPANYITVLAPSKYEYVIIVDLTTHFTNASNALKASIEKEVKSLFSKADFSTYIANIQIERSIYDGIKFDGSITDNKTINDIIHAIVIQDTSSNPINPADFNDKIATLASITFI